MVQPGNPYQNQGFGGQQPWGQPPQPGDNPWGPPGQPTAWGPSASLPPAGSPPPVPVWPGPPGYQPPPPPKSNAGLIAVVVGGAVLLLVVAIGVVLLFQGRTRGPIADATPGATAPPSASPSISPTPEYVDPDSLDSADTDRTRLSTGAMFPDRSFVGDNDETYTLAGTLKTGACGGVGGEPVRKLLKKYDCDRMVVGVWLNSDEDLFSALLVIPFQTKEDAEALHSDIIADKQDIINALTYYCPGDGKPGAKLCKRSSDNLPTWYASFTTFHRYLFVAISLYTDGHRSQKMSVVDEFTAETVGYVSDVLLGTR